TSVAVSAGQDGPSSKHDEECLVGRGHLTVCRDGPSSGNGRLGAAGCGGFAACRAALHRGWLPSVPTEPPGLGPPLLIRRPVAWRVAGAAVGWAVLDRGTQWEGGGGGGGAVAALHRAALHRGKVYRTAAGGATGTSPLLVGRPFIEAGNGWRCARRTNGVAAL